MKFKLNFILGIFMSLNILNSKASNEILSEIILITEEKLITKEENLYALIKSLKNKLLSEDELNSFEKTFEIIDEIYFQLYKFINPLNFYHLCGKDSKLKELTNSAKLKVFSWFNKEIETDSKIYKILLEANKKIENLSDIQKKLISDVLNIFKLSGADLPEEKKNLLIEKNEILNKLCLEFSENIQNENRKVLASKDEFTGIEDDFLNSLEKNESGLYILNLDYPTSSKILKFCKNRKLREKYHKAFSKRAYPNNLEILEKIRFERKEYAKILGFETYADLDLCMTMAKDKETVKNFIEKNIKESLDSARIEKSNFIEFTKENLKEEIDEIKPWDISYILNIYEKKELSLDNKKISEYFPLEKTTEKLLEIYSTFFGINLKIVECKDQDWFYEDSIKKIDVSNSENNLIGVIIFDPFPRELKYSHACMSQLKPTKFKASEGLKNIPIVSMVCNFTKPTKEKDSLLNHNEVTTLFHEFGHALHFIFCNKIPYFFLANDFPCDFVEIPSQLFEEWAWEPEILKILSNHFEKNEPLSDEIINSMLKSKHFMENILFKQTQSKYSLFSLEFFSTDKTAKEIKVENFNKTLSLTSFDEDNFFECSFGHLTGYGSKYYSYAWSLYYSEKIFESIKSKNGILDQKIGKDFSKKILEIGNSKDLKVELKNYLNF